MFYGPGFIESVFSTMSDRVDLPEDLEVETIRAAQAGDHGAQLRLVQAYAPALRRLATTFLRRFPAEERAAATEDVRAEALVAFLGMIQDHDLERSPRLAGRVVQVVTGALRHAARLDASMAVPSRTLSRFYTILGKVDGDVDLARAIAPDYAMAVTTFDEVLRIVRGTVPLSDEDDEGGWLVAAPLADGQGSLSEVEDALMVAHALRVLSSDERQVVRYAYGFETGEPLSDAGVVQAMSEAALGREAVDAGQTVVSRQTVQRRRGAALARMREALGAPPI
ncbi:sigma-70 family RNA polymerase sigma factor [Nocardioides ochotonae]|uniref:helix-turn-helix domain-containing protein n=1 Tax=Nocardioides ochotonae TaxID=2685869 RepID=UPI00140BEFF7|nr:helix-turn-helix domain-containing protein [Nocardioides ochotonae]